jgi:hypothetical protein
MRSEDLYAELAQARLEIARFRGLLADQELTSERLFKRLKESKSALHECATRLKESESALHEYAKQFNEIHDSTSWRVSRPLRALRDTVRKIAQAARSRQKP